MLYCSGPSRNRWPPEKGGLKKLNEEMIYKGVGRVKETTRDGKAPGTSSSGTNSSMMPLPTLGLKEARFGGMIIRTQ